MDPYELSRKRRPLLSPCASMPSCWRPPVDVYRNANAWICKFDLAGVTRDEVDIRVQGRTLTVAGERRDQFACEGRRAYTLEIAYHRFERTVDLPCALDAATIACEYRDGMLTVTVTGCEGQP